MHDPILITGPPRSGTSMIAGLIHFHGAWIGEAEGTRYPGSNTDLGTENPDFKMIIRDILKKNGIHEWNIYPLPGKSVKLHDFRGTILNYVHTSGPWLIKTAGLLYYPDLWLEAFPKAKWVFPRRQLEDIVLSFRRHPSMRKRKNVKEYVEALWERQDAIAESGATHFWVFPDQFMLDDKDEGHARSLVEFCGLRFDKDIFRNWVDPRMWHGSAK